MLARRQVVSASFNHSNVVQAEFFVIGPFSGPGWLSSLAVMLAVDSSAEYAIGFSLGSSAEATRAAFTGGTPLIGRGQSALTDADLAGMRLFGFGNIPAIFDLPLWVHVGGGSHYVIVFMDSSGGTLDYHVTVSVVVERDDREFREA